MPSLEPRDIQLALQYFDPGTARRGREYFRAGRVISCERLESGSYQFQVQGSQPGLYTVTLTFDGRRLANSCSCPMMAHCKHVYASLLFLEENGDLQLTGLAVAEQPQRRIGFFNLVPRGRTLSKKEVGFINRLEKLYRTHQRGCTIDGFALSDLFPAWKISSPWLAVRIAPKRQLTRLQFWHFLVAILTERHVSVPGVFGESNDVAPSLNLIQEWRDEQVREEWEES
jgi:hypothetical protein